MTARILGPRASRRRRRFLLAPIFLVALVALFVTAGAQAVHDAGVFQLDGDAQTSVNSTPPALEDWDKVCPAVSPPSRPLTDPVHCLGGTTATDHTFIPDAFMSSTDDIFKGGTDDAEISGWQWKQAGPSPDKADIEQAFAAQYTVTAPGPYENHKLLYFGGTRFANNGNTNIGFWFFQDEVTTLGTKAVQDPVTGAVSCPVQSGCGFDGLHTAGTKSLGGNIPGDIFILSAFTGGGEQPTIKVFEWVGPGNATKDYLGSNNCFTNACTLQPLAIPNTPGFNDNRCDAGAQEDVACALVNSGSKPSPWLFQDKTSGAPANVFGDAEFYEGGLDLTGLGFGDVCFQSTLLNTRSSQSGTSVLQDFAIGGFGECTSDIVTTPQTGAGGSIPAAGLDIPTTASGNTISVRDHADITVTGVSTFGGTVTFFLCGPLALNTSSNCESGGVQIGLPVAVNGSAGTAAVNSASATLTSIGRYCWRAEYSGDTDKDVPASSDPDDGDTTNLSECFKVNPITPTLTTDATDGPVNAPATLSDTATLSGTASQPGTNGLGGAETIAPGSINATNGAAANGSITFTAFGPNNCTTVAMAATTRAVSGDGTYPTASQSAVSFLATAVGTYTFVASYSGSSPNTNSVPDTACPETGVNKPETVVVNDTSSVSTHQRWLPNDSATVSSAGGTPVSGTLTIALFESSDCTGTAVTGQTYTFTLTNATTPADRTKSTDNQTYLVETDKTVSWKSTFVSSNPNLSSPAAPTCEVSTVDLTPNQ